MSAELHWGAALLEVPAAVIISGGEGSVPGTIISAGREEELPEHVGQCPWRQLAPTHRTCLPFNASAMQGVCGFVMCGNTSTVALLCAPPWSQLRSRWE